MGLLTLSWILASACSLWFVLRSGIEDFKARANVREDASPASFRLRPFHLFRPDLYTEVGERHRRAALRAMAGFAASVLVTGLLAALDATLGC